MSARRFPWDPGAEPSDRAIVAFMWDGSRVIRRLAVEDPDPSPEELDAIARDLLAKNSKRQDGVLPRVRVVATRSVRRPEPPDLAA